MISKSTIDAIFMAARVEEVISDYVTLKKSGSNLKGLSPFNEEKSPSFMVSPAKQIWKDFSSGKGGNVVSFLMEIEQFTYPEALRYLAKKYNIEIEDEGGNDEEYQKTKEEKELLFQVSEVANTYFKEQLLQTEEGETIGLSYFKERGFLLKTIEQFQLGYSPKQRDAFTQYALGKGYTKEILEKSGLSIFNEQGNAVDRFRERVMFPIHSFSGRVLGFGGRILNSTLKTAKYLNSPESPIYNKSKILYGLFQSKSSIIKQDQCILVEGYTDVISLHQNGVTNVVSSSGTSLTEDQILLIKRLTRNILILFDGDPAGIKASFRGIDMLLTKDMNVRVVLLPEAEDPDSFAQKHSQDEMFQFLEQESKDFIQFKTDLLFSEAKDDPIKKGELIRDIVRSIALIPNLIQREIYVQECSKIMDISETVLFKELSQHTLQRQREESKQQKKEEPLQLLEKEKYEEYDAVEFLELELIQLALKHGDQVIEVALTEETPEGEEKEEEIIETTVLEEMIQQLEMDTITFVNELYRGLWENMKAGIEQDELRVASYYIQSENNDWLQLATNALIEKYSLSENWKKKEIYIPPEEKHIKKAMEETILRYKWLITKDLIDKIHQEEVEPDLQQQKMIKIMHLIELRRKINEKLNRVV